MSHDKGISKMHLPERDTLEDDSYLKKIKLSPELRSTILEIINGSEARQYISEDAKSELVDRLNKW